jgi:hypothetical protein
MGIEDGRAAKALWSGTMSMMVNKGKDDGCGGGGVHLVQDVQERMNQKEGGRPGSGWAASLWTASTAPSSLVHLLTMCCIWQVP